jgi:hypothetical protein
MPLIAGPPDTLTPLSVGVVSDHAALVLRGSVNVAASVAREPEELVGVANSLDILVFVTQGSCPYLEG